VEIKLVSIGLLSFQKPKIRSVHGRPQVANHLVPNQVLGFFEFFREREGGRFLLSKACKSLYRRGFKKIEDAPFARLLPPPSRSIKL
jgi:hypothetical protein